MTRREDADKRLRDRLSGTRRAKATQQWWRNIESRLLAAKQPRLIKLMDPGKAKQP